MFDKVSKLWSLIDDIFQKKAKQIMLQIILGHICPLLIHLTYKYSHSIITYAFNVI